MNYYLSKSESSIMMLFWEYGPMSVAQLQEVLHPCQWKSTTIYTFLKRLEEKQVLASCKVNGRRQYSATISADAYKAKLSKHFLDQFFAGDITAFVLAVSDKQDLVDVQMG